MFVVYKYFNPYIMKNKKTLISLIVILLLNTTLFSQELSTSKSANIKDFPEYVIVTSQNTKLFGGINIVIDSKKSKYEDQLDNLADLLQSRHGLKVRNQTDLLNAMSQLGFDYINSYNASAVMPSGNNDDVDDILNTIDGGEGSYKVNMVFRKKLKYRE